MPIGTKAKIEARREKDAHRFKEKLMSPQSTGRQWDRLVQVIARGDLQTIKQLDYEDIDILMKNSRGATGLMYAAQANNQFAHQVLEYFLERGSDVDDVDRAGWTALFYAAQAGEELSVNWAANIK